jgi:hypothetical protein
VCVAENQSVWDPGDTSPKPFGYFKRAKIWWIDDGWIDGCDSYFISRVCKFGAQPFILSSPYSIPNLGFVGVVVARSLEMILGE